jgi:hypothetical protein
MIDAMRAALKELEDVLECINQDKIPFDGDDFHETLRNLRQAIAEAEKESTLQEVSDIGQEIEQEPVAQCTNNDTWNCKYCRKTETCEALKDSRNFVAPPKQPVKSYTGGVPQYATDAPKREWVNLTTDNKVSLMQQHPGHLTLNSIDAIQAKLKELNQ